MLEIAFPVSHGAKRIVCLGRTGGGLPYYRERELVVPLSDQCYCVAVPGLEGEGVSGECAAAAGCVDG